MISKKPGVVGGAACIAGTRIPVSCIAVGCADAGDEWILENYPTLTIDDVNEARAYAAAHPDEMRRETETEEDELDRLRDDNERLRTAIRIALNHIEHNEGNAAHSMLTKAVTP